VTKVCAQEENKKQESKRLPEPDPLCREVLEESKESRSAAKSEGVGEGEQKKHKHVNDGCAS
jgi:hypothetical protein